MVSDVEFIDNLCNVLPNVLMVTWQWKRLPGYLQVVQMTHIVITLNDFSPVLSLACCSRSDYKQHFRWFCNSLKCGRSVILKLVDAYSKRHGVYHACKYAYGIIFHSHSQTSHSRRERTSLHQLQQVSWNDGHIWDSEIQHKMFPLFMQIPQSR